MYLVHNLTKMSLAFQGALIPPSGTVSFECIYDNATLMRYFNTGKITYTQKQTPVKPVKATEPVKVDVTPVIETPVVEPVEAITEDVKEPVVEDTPADEPVIETVEEVIPKKRSKKSKVSDDTETK